MSKVAKDKSKGKAQDKSKDKPKEKPTDKDKAKKKKKKEPPLPTFEDFTPEQIENFKQFYLSFDKKEEGFVRPKSLPAMLRSLNTNPTEQFLQNNINRITKENKGEMSFEEFLNILLPLLRTTGTDEQIREAFRIFDPDGTETMGVEELRYLLTTLGEPLQPEEIEVMLRMADPDRDGIIHYEDFVTQMYK